MNSFTDKLQKWLSPMVNFAGSNKYFTAIRDAFSVTTAFLIAGSLALILQIFVTGSTGLAGVAGFEWLANYSHIFSTINFVGVSCISLEVVAVLGYQLGKANKTKPVITMILSISCFLTMVDQDNVGGSLGAKSLFLALIVGLTSTALFKWLMGFEKIKIKMPEGVPPMIADSFNTLNPTMLVMLVYGLIAGILYGQAGVYINDVIYNVIQAPFTNVAESLPGLIVVLVFQQLFWWMGIHGNNAMKGAMSTFWEGGLALNAELIAAGQVATHWNTINFQHLFICLGGSGQVIGLALAILLFSKKKDQKEITKASILPVVCGIDEPLVYGLPIMLNPTYLIPFLVAPIVCGIIGYVASTTGFLQSAYIRDVSGMPMFIQQFLGYNGQASAIILTVVCIVLSTLIYTPFVLLDNRMSEQNTEEVK